MSASATLNSSLSPSFDRARRISGFQSVILAIGFWLTAVFLVVLVCGAVALLIFHPDPSLFANGKIQLDGGTIRLDQLSEIQRYYAIAALGIATVPTLFILHHARRVFGHFKQGEVFAAAPIEHIRQTGMWLMLSLAANFVGQILIDLAIRTPRDAVDLDANPIFLVFGLGVYVAAYVMAEARRIADDNANII